MQDTFKYEDLPSVNTDFSRNTAGSYITLVDSGPYIQKNGDLTVSVQSEEIVPEPLQYRVYTSGVLLFLADPNSSTRRSAGCKGCYKG